MKFRVRHFALAMLLVMIFLAAFQMRAQQAPSPADNQTTSPSTPAPPIQEPTTPPPGASSSEPKTPQTPPAPRPGREGQIEKGANGEYTLRTSVTEVVLYATVVDDHQRLVTNLQRQNFHVYEDGAPQTISSFRREDVPVSLGILVDNSGSMQAKRAAINVAALDLVRASNPQDESFIVNFSEQAFLDQDFTANIQLLEKGLSHIDSRGGTALYDAVIAAADHLSKDAKRPKQVILIITDGEDNSSSATLEDTVRRIQSLHGPIVYSIGLLFDEDRGQAHRARKALEELSDQTGGLAFFPRSLDQVDAIAKEVAADIRQQYILGYHPTRPVSAGGYRTIQVTASAPDYGKLTVRTRAGYFAGADGK
jgi:VWFA-related protein